MPRSTVPSYVRVSHIPNILEAYRYLSRVNITTLSSTLGMSYHTIRRLCNSSTRPQTKTLDKLQTVYPFVNSMTWDIWVDRCTQALHAEKHCDYVELTTIETLLRGMLPTEEVLEPIHFMPGASIEFAKSLFEGSKENKSATFYLSNVHTTALDLLAIHSGLAKSEYLRYLIEEKLRDTYEVSESLIQVLSGAPAKVIRPTPTPSPMELTTKELEAYLPPSISTKEVLAQVRAEIPKSIDTTQESVTDIAPAVLEEDHTEDVDVPLHSPGNMPDWLPSNVFTKESNLTDEELESMFSGE